MHAIEVQAYLARDGALFSLARVSLRDGALLNEETRRGRIAVKASRRGA